MKVEDEEEEKPKEKKPRAKKAVKEVVEEKEEKPYTSEEEYICKVQDVIREVKELNGDKTTRGQIKTALTEKGIKVPANLKEIIENM